MITTSFPRCTIQSICFANWPICPLTGTHKHACAHISDIVLKHPTSLAHLKSLLDRRDPLAGGGCLAMTILHAFCLSACIVWIEFLQEARPVGGWWLLDCDKSSWVLSAYMLLSACASLACMCLHVPCLLACV